MNGRERERVAQEVEKAVRTEWAGHLRRFAQDYGISLAGHRVFDVEFLADLMDPESPLNLAAAYALEDAKAADREFRQHATAPLLADKSGGLTVGELLVTEKAAAYCGRPGCGHGDNIHGPFCFAAGCECCDWVWA